MKHLLAYRVIIVAALMIFLLSGCVVQGGSSVTINFQTDKLSVGEKVYLRYSDGTVVTNPIDQSNAASVIISNTESTKTLIGGYVSDGNVSWVPNYSYPFSSGIVNVNEIAAVKPAFPVDHVVQVGQPNLDPNHPGFVGVTFAVYGTNGTVVNGKTEVFAHSTDASVVFYNTDPADVNNPSSTANQGFSSYTVNGLVTFVIQADLNTISSKPLTLYSGSKLIYDSKITPDIKSLAIGYATGDSSTHISKNITLPTSGANGTSIVWTSSHPEIVSSSGEVQQPSFGSGDANVSVTASVYNNALFLNKAFNLIVKEKALLAPPPPTGLQALTGDAQVSLNWNGVADATSYKIFKGTTTGIYDAVPVANVSNGTSYNVTGLINGTSYYFAVKASNAAGDSAYSAEATGTPHAPIVIPSLTGLTLNPSTLSLQAGSTAVTTATANYSDNSTRNVTNDLAWTFSTAGVASISNGAVSALNAGNTVATAVYGNQTAQLNITVTAPVHVPSLTGLTLNPSTLSLQAGSTAVTTATANYSDNSTHNVTNDLTWTFSTAGVASISNGAVSALNAGTTVATATYGNQTAQLNITVTAPVHVPSLTGLTLNPSTLSLQAGSTAVTTATANYSDNSTLNVTNDLTWTFSTAGVASISNGAVSALNAGTTVATAVYGNQTAQLNVTVTVPEHVSSLTGLTLNPSTLSLQVGSTAVTTATANYSDSSTRNVTTDLAWTFSNSGVVSINNGVVTATNVGTTVATATYGNQTAQLTVTAFGHSSSKRGGGAAVTTPTTPETTAPETPSTSLPAVPTEKGNLAQVISFLKAAIAQAQSSAKPVPFSDISNHWSTNTVNLFVKLGVVSGYEDGSFRPDANITRAEFASIIAKVFNMQSASGAPSLKDVNNHWAKQAIQALGSQGIINGYEDGTFKPDQTITRAEMIAIISRLVDLSSASKGNSITFTDVNGSWNADQIKAASQAGIVEGRTSTTFAPDATSTKAEALTIILRALELNPEIKDLLNSLK
ncbi:S-layer homology domain-containing protein [Paenibacillus sp. RC67]|uniref:S-layer homology domain-containing protein n=1 Tax=Paenibacillus sp. RC67 TaxID=3039392 RepID=UPI0024AE65EF|nr:S-layer homology domain-containing protein [Paenibacillus sp. RC67]